MINQTKTLIIDLIECKIKILREFLFRIAIGDGILSNAEMNILFSIDLNLDLLHDSVISAYDDNIIDEHEINEFERIIRQIEDEAISTARFDDCITHDDRRLIKILQILLIEFQKILLR